MPVRDTIDRIIEDDDEPKKEEPKKIEYHCPPQQRTRYETMLVSDGVTAGTRRVSRQVYHDMNGRRADR